MARNSAPTRARIMMAAYGVFFRKGFQRASLDEIAAKAGVTKRTLYYHVRSKDELAGAMLVHQHEFVLGQVTRWLGPMKAKGVRGAEAAVDSLFAALGEWAQSERAARRHYTGSGFTRMAMELADLPGHPARVATRRHKTAIEQALAERFAHCGIGQAQERAAQVQMLLEGAMTLMLIHGDVRYAVRAGAAARRVIAG